jgi:hydrogenase maturation protein HypF
MERRALAVRGTVQGVGFRPFVYNLACRLALTGFVRNLPHGVLIEVEGDAATLDRFERTLTTSTPHRAAIERLERTTVAPHGDAGFRIDASLTETAHAQAVRVAPDVATCAACLRELNDPANRRFQYPFITCVDCGPRLTVIERVPYDRERTTMAAFTMCAECEREFRHPDGRRFHAQTLGCHDCGPRLALHHSGPSAGPPWVAGNADEVAALIARAATLLREGAILAIKGLGGYHLACDATSDAAVTSLRHRKDRDEKPFAVMFSSLRAAAAACQIDEREADILSGRVRPVVLLQRRPAPAGSRPACNVAPGSPVIGAMLPATPLHHLLLRAVQRPLVMTSGNRSDEPTVYEDQVALQQLSGITDAFLTHDRRIRVRCDDGVTRVVGGREVPVRRSRGEAPRPITLPVPCPVPVLAVGAQLKNTCAIGVGRDAIVSHHVGDLDAVSAYDAFCRDARLLEQLFNVEPQIVAHDAHPTYASTRYALERAATRGLRTLRVQHHHAHIASCMAEHGLSRPVIGVAFDGTGYGDDDTVWGGEILTGDLRHVIRAAHLRPVRMAGGDQAVREPWRMALAHVLDAGADPSSLRRRAGAPAARVVEQMLERGVNAPLTSSVGRLFDAVAAIVLRRDRAGFEGQPAMQLEWVAMGDDDGQAGGDRYVIDVVAQGDALLLDPRALIRQVVEDEAAGVPPARIARAFHRALAAAVGGVCAEIRARTGLDTVVLSGGVFHNALLTLDCEQRLSSAGFRVYRHQVVPPGDGGISLGQLAVAAARLAHQAGSDPCV